MVIAVGFLMSDTTAAMAKKFPNTKFAIVDVNAPFMKGKPKNVRGITFAEQEAGCLVGVAAATVSKTQVIGSVGGLKIPPVDAFIAGYQYCAKKIKPGITTLNGYSQDFVAQDKCKEVALNQIGQDADVVFQVAGGCGLGVLQAAKDQKKWGIGVDNDQGFLGNHVLTSATKKVDVGRLPDHPAREEQGLEGRRRWRLQREEPGRRLRQAEQDGTEPRRAGEPPRQVVEGPRLGQGQAAAHRHWVTTRRRQNGGRAGLRARPPRFRLQSDTSSSAAAYNRANV